MENTSPNKTQEENSNVLETVLYGFSSFSLLGVLGLAIAQRIRLYDNVVAIYGVTGLFALLILFYSYYTVRMILRINETFGKKSYIGLTIFYVGFLAILWAVSSIVTSKLISKFSWENTELVKSVLYYFIVPGKDPLMIYSGLGLGITGILLEITNIDEYVLYPLLKVFGRGIVEIYRFIRSTLFFNTFIVFFTAKHYCPKQWPYSPTLFAFLISFFWIIIFNPKIMRRTWTLIRQNVVATLDVIGLVLIIVGMFVKQDITRYSLIGLGLVIIITANSRTLIKWISNVAKRFYALVSKYPLETLSITLMVSGIIVSVLFLVLGLPSYYGPIIIVLGILIQPKLWYRILINTVHKIRSTPELNAVFHLVIISIIILLGIIGGKNKNVALLFTAGILTIGLIIWDYDLIVRSWRIIKRVLPIVFRYLREHLREILRVLKGVLRVALWVNILLTVVIPKTYQGYALYVMGASLLLVALLDYQVIIEEPRKTINNVAALFFFFFMFDYLVIVKTRIYLYLALAMIVILVINNSKKLLEFLVKLGKALYRIVISLLNWLVRIAKRLGKLVADYSLVFVYLILELLLVVYALWIIFSGDPLHILPVKTFADRLSMGGGILLLALASNLLLADKIKLFFKQAIYSKERRRR